MSKYTLVLADELDDAITKECADYNARPKADGTPNLTTEEFLANELSAIARPWIDQHDIAMTTDIVKFREAVKADPMAVKAAILAHEAKDAATNPPKDGNLDAMPAKARP